MFMLIVRIGLRPGEAAGLRWSSIEGATVHVVAARRERHGRPEIVDDLKTIASQRSVALPRDLVATLDSHGKRQAEEQLAASTCVDPTLVFASRNGTALSAANVRRELRRICKAAGVTPVTPTDLRRSCASLLSEEGVPNHRLKDFMGHTTTRMVDQHYRRQLSPVVDVAAVTDWASSR